MTAALLEGLDRRGADPDLLAILGRALGDAEEVALTVGE